jgi:glucose-6-phosphate isomerase
MLGMAMSARSEAWAALEAHAARLADTRIEDLIAVEPERAERFHHRLGPLLLDLSKQRLDDDALEALLALAASAQLHEAIHAMFSGAPVNVTEERAALHGALRFGEPEAGARSPAADAARQAEVVLRRMDVIVGEIRAAAAHGGLTDFVHVGIGGSDLGPRLVCAALGAREPGAVRTHFLSNIDGNSLDALVRSLDPRRTVVCLASKSFATEETLLNARSLRAWLSAGKNDGLAVERLYAVTANVGAAKAFGLGESHILPFWDWVGGRYSVWSAVGLPIAARFGTPIFRRFLAGARVMDVHYESAPFDSNLPVLLALAGIWNRNLLGFSGYAVVPYDDRLRDLPAYLQQLEMESNGKSTTLDGQPVARATAPLLVGGVGTNVQHAFFQALHQGTDVVPVDFIGVVRAGHMHVEHQRALLANMLAQGAALMRGTRDDEVAVDAQRVPDARRREILERHRRCAGNRPSTTLLLDELTPDALGMLIALYEHKVHAQGLLWNIDSFDQFGVELGKRIAKSVAPALAGEEGAHDLDHSTLALVRQIRERSG